MTSLVEPTFIKSVKGKVLLGFFIAFIALGASWVISKIAFENMLGKIDVLSTPSDKLRLVNKVFKNILELDHLQNASSLKGDERKIEFFSQSSQLIAILDSLKGLNIDDAVQIVRIDSMKSLLRERERIYYNYVKVRSRLVSNKALSEEVKSISGLITENKLKPDSTVVKTEKRTTTTTIYTEIPDSVKIAEEERKGFFNRVFGSKKNKKSPVPEVPKVLQKQEVNVEVDTVTFAKADSTIEKVGEAVNAIEKSQKVRTTRFVDREQELSTAGNSLVQQLSRVMQEVEADVLKQSNDDYREAKKMIANSKEHIKQVMVGFCFLTFLLAYLIFSDITKSNAYRSQLEEAKEEAEYHSLAKQRFLSNMSHEIRTPLQSIIGYTESLKNDERPKKQDIETLHTASEHLLYLVNEVLDYSRIISDQFTFEERTFGITPLLNDVIQMLRPTAAAKGLELLLDDKLPPALYLLGDPFRLRQVLYNLLTNAIKFTDTGEICIKANCKDLNDKVNIEFQISDTGIGLSPEQSQRVFNQFEQADPSITRRFGGTGLGLSIVKALVEGMNGSVQVKSTLGKGTTFYVRTLMTKAETPVMALEESEKKVYKVNGKVWLVDDDAFILKWCSSVLELNKILHQCFSSAEEVLSHPWDTDVCFVLTDMRMPGMNGAELCQRLRRVAPKGIKFFVLTAQALPEERENILKLGFDGILMKPFHSSDLLELLENSSGKPTRTTTSLDFSALAEMTFGDESLLKEILEQFVKDSKSDLLVMKEHLECGNLEAVQELMHRLAGRTGQIGASELSAKFRNFEVELRKDRSKVAVSEMKALVKKAGLMIEEVEEKALSYSI